MKGGQSIDIGEEEMGQRKRGHTLYSVCGVRFGLWNSLSGYY